jgi:hypothetical protein
MFLWPRDVALQPGEWVDWELTAEGMSAATIGGRWWLLDESSMERLFDIEKVVAEVEDDEVRPIARMMAFGELGLYDEAASLLDALSTLTPPSGRAALLHRAGAILFGEMLTKMPSEINAKAKAWIYHRWQEQMIKLEECLPRSLECTRHLPVPSSGFSLKEEIFGRA